MIKRIYSIVILLSIGCAHANNDSHHRTIYDGLRNLETQATLLNMKVYIHHQYSHALLNGNNEEWTQRLERGFQAISVEENIRSNNVQENARQQINRVNQILFTHRQFNAPRKQLQQKYIHKKGG